MRRIWRILLSSRRAASAWVRSPRKTACMILRTSRSFWLMVIRSGESTLIDMAPPWPEQGGHFYCVKTGHFYCRSTPPAEQDSDTFFRASAVTHSLQYPCHRRPRHFLGLSQDPGGWADSSALGA